MLILLLLFSSSQTAVAGKSISGPSDIPQRKDVASSEETGDPYPLALAGLADKAT